MTTEANRSIQWVSAIDPRYTPSVTHATSPPASPARPNVPNPQVTFFQRKTRWSGNFSLEFIFQDVRERLAADLDSQLHVAPYYSNGLFRRVAIALDAWRHQGQINHVTGDINFAAILLDPRRTILTNHDCGFLDSSTAWKRRLLKLFWLELPVRRARFVTAVSEESKNQVLQHTHCEPDKVVVIYNPISTRFRYTPGKFPSTNVRILQVGTAPNKNIPRLAEALQGLNCTLVIIGTMGPPLIEQLRQRGIQYENYERLPIEEIVRQYEMANIVSFASTLEGFGMPIVEANAVGRPVVTSHLSSMPEVAGDAACLVDPFDVSSIREGIQRVIKDCEYREQLVGNGLRNVARFHPEAIAQKYLQLYRQIAAETRERTRS